VLGKTSPSLLPAGAHTTPSGTVSVELPRRLLRRPRPVHWTEDEVEDLCRRLNAIDAVVMGADRS
jgi:hypothetical protein